ncbi:MAG: ABC transporter permease [Candidatus Bathyarchaeota archaeon]|nr:ABC transporter permease [Candidatus Bathyarchaeota archaeon]
MIDPLKENFLKAVHIAQKDTKIYFFKGPNITFGLLFPAIIYLAFSVGRTAEISFIIPGLVAMSSLFGAGAIESIALPLERAKGTFDRLLTAPIPLSVIVFGKALGGFFFGVFLSIAYMLIALLIPGATIVNPLLFAVGILLSALAFSALGVCLSTPFRDVPQAMPPATLIRIAMVFLGGVFIPIATMPSFLQVISYLLPITYAVNMLQMATTGQLISQALVIDVSALILFTLIFFALATLVLKRTLK